MGTGAEMRLTILFLASRKQPCDPHIEGSLLIRAFSRKLAMHFIHEINTITYDVSDVNLFPPHLNEIPPQKRGLKHPSYTTNISAK